MHKKTFIVIASSLLFIIVALVVANYSLNRKFQQSQPTGPESSITIEPPAIDTLSEQSELEGIVIDDDESEFESLQESANQL